MCNLSLAIHLLFYMVLHIIVVCMCLTSSVLVILNFGTAILLKHYSIATVRKSYAFEISLVPRPFKRPGNADRVEYDDSMYRQYMCI